MKINTQAVIKTVEGEAYKTDGKDSTLGMIVSKQLSVVKSPDPMRSYVLTQDFYSKDELDLTAEEIAFVQARIKESDLFPHVAGQIMMILDGKEV